MKKYILVFAVIVSVTLAACGSGSTSNETTDSTATTTDSTVLDSTNVGTAVNDSTAKIEEVK
jgi:outer membrane lipoprotein SlyB